MTPVTIIRGSGPVILAQPHSGVFLPPEMKGRLNDLGRQLLDTDWHVPTLYDGLLPNATTIRANFSRYVIDVNRDPEGKSLYPGQNTTELVPTTSFDGEKIWHTPPTDDEVIQRIQDYHAVYHTTLHAELHRVRQRYGVAVLYDCHSIRSTIPHLFEGRLPDLNIGTNDGVSCGQTLTDTVAHVCAQQSEFTHVVNGRFKGGWTTRHYGQPGEGIHAIQMELSQRTYLHDETPPFNYDRQGAAKLRVLLRTILTAIQTKIETDYMTEKPRG